jgi:serine/threonine protein kinase
MPISPPLQGPSRDPLRDWFPTEKISEGRWSLLLRVHPSSSPRSEGASFLLRTLRAPARPGSFAHQRLAQEVAVTHALRHLAIPPVVDSELHGAHPFTVVPYVAARPISLWRGAAKKPPLGLACWIIRQAASAVASLHAAGLRHGQIEPSHLLLHSDGRVALVGLGAAAPIGSQIPGAEFAINPAYAAPEQFSPAPAEAASDVYSLGAVLFELLTQRRPHEPQQEEEWEAMHRLAPIPDLRVWAPDAPHALRSLIRRMLAKEPLRRPDLAEVIQQLCDFEIASFHDWAAVA